MNETTTDETEILDPATRRTLRREFTEHLREIEYLRNRIAELTGDIAGTINTMLEPIEMDEYEFDEPGEVYLALDEAIEFLAAAEYRVESLRGWVTEDTD